MSHHSEYLPFSSLWYEEVHEIAFQLSRLHTVRWERLGLGAATLSPKKPGLNQLGRVNTCMY